MHIYLLQNTYGEDKVRLDDVSDEGEHGTASRKMREW